MKNAAFGLFIKGIRTEKGIPQRLVAYALNIDTSTYSKMELGERQISIEMIEALAKAIETDFKLLMIEYIEKKILTDFENQPYLKEAINKLYKTL